MTEKPGCLHSLNIETLKEILKDPPKLCPRCHGMRTIGVGYIVGGLRLEGQISGSPHEPRIPCPECSKPNSNENNMNEILEEVIDELERADAKFAPFNSAHEGYAILLEEVDELWEAVRMKDSEDRDKRLHDEAVQVAAMALKFLLMLGGK